MIVCALLPTRLHSAAASQEPARRTVAKPRFEDYPVDQVSTKKPASIRWPPNMDPNDPETGKFTESVKEAVAHGPNFAGHYAIAHWGLGTGISSIAVVDLATGRVFREMPFVFVDVPWDPEDKSPYRGYSFRSDSTLLIASGCFYKGESQSGNDCGWKYYKWEQNRFVLLRAVPGPVPSNFRRQKKPQE